MLFNAIFHMPRIFLTALAVQRRNTCKSCAASSNSKAPSLYFLSERTLCYSLCLDWTVRLNTPAAVRIRCADACESALF